METEMQDYLAQRDADLANAEGALLSLYQQLEEKKHESEVLKAALLEEQMARSRAEKETGERKAEVTVLQERCMSMQNKLVEARRKLARAKTPHRDKTLKEQQERGSSTERELFERCRLLEHQLTEERKIRKEAEAASEGSDNSTKENLPRGDEDAREQASALKQQVQLMKDGISVRDSKIQALERRCHRLEEKRMEAETELVVSNGYVAELEERNKSLTHDLSTLNGPLHEGQEDHAEKDIHRGDKEIKVWEDQVVSLREKCRSLEAELSDSQVSKELLADLREGKAKLQAELKRVEKECSSKEHNLQTLKHKCERLETQLSMELERMEKECHLKEADVQTLRDRCGLLEAKLIDQKPKDTLSKVDGVELVKQLQKKNQSLMQQLNQLKTQDGTVEDDILNLSLDEERNILREKAEELGRTQAALDESHQSLEECLSRNKQLQQYLDDARKMAITLQQEVTGKKSECEQLSGALLEQDKAREKLSSHNEKLQGELQRAQVVISGLQKELSEIRSDCEEAANVLLEEKDKCSSRNKQLQSELDFARRQISHMQNQRKATQDETSIALEERSQSLQRLQSRHKKLQEELERANQRVIELEHDFSARNRRRFVSAEALRQEQFAISRYDLEGGKHPNQRKNSRRSRKPPHETTQGSSFVHSSLSSFDQADALPPVPLHIRVVQGDDMKSEPLLAAGRSSKEFVVM